MFKDLRQNREIIRVRIGRIFRKTEIINTISAGENMYDDFVFHLNPSRFCHRKLMN